MSGGNNTLEYRSIPPARASARPLYKPGIVCMVAAFIPEAFYVLRILVLNSILQSMPRFVQEVLNLVCIFVSPLATFFWAFFLERRLRKVAGLYRGALAVNIAAIVSAAHIVMVSIVYGGRGI